MIVLSIFSKRKYDILLKIESEGLKISKFRRSLAFFRVLDRIRFRPTDDSGTTS